MAWRIGGVGLAGPVRGGSWVRGSEDVVCSSGANLAKPYEGKAEAEPPPCMGVKQQFGSRSTCRPGLLENPVG